MANLNFQQPPRSIAASSLVSRGAGAGAGGAGFGVSSASAFPTPPPQQPSPASQNVSQQRQAQLLGQRAFADRRSAMPGVTNSNSMVGIRGSLQGVVMGGGDGPGSIVAPPLLDPSEFPSLTVRGQGDQPHHHIPPPGTKPYVGMVKQPTAEQSEFTMSSEDFPALPGTSVGGSGAVGGGSGAGGLNSGGGGGSVTMGPGGVQQSQTGPIGTSVQGQPDTRDGPQSITQHDHTDRHGIQSFPDGKVTNIPPSMVPNQFGMVGLLTFIRAAESDSELVSLALGQDLTTLGLNLNSPENLYLTFAGPWAESPCRPQDIDYHVPPEYLINMSIREKLAPVKLNRYKEDLLFYLFYCFVGDVLQLAAASELYNREWRYHTEEKVWITQAPGVATLEKTTTYERGTYYYFDAQSWRKQTKEFHLDYSKLEGRPQMPAHFQLEHSKQQQQQQQHFHT